MTTASFVPNHLDWPSCLNVRDVGGLPTRSGEVVRTGGLIRSDSLHRLTAEGIAAFRTHGISRIIDLRRRSECEREVSPFVGQPAYVNIPVQDPADPDHEWLELAEIYVAMLDLRPDLFASAVGAVADAPPGAVVVHCAGGKDRTGLIIAMSLAIAGVSPELIAADYALSEEQLREDTAAQLAALTDERLLEIAKRLTPTPASNMLRVLEHLESEHGGVDAYLTSAGLSPAQLDALRSRLVVAA